MKKYIMLLFLPIVCFSSTPTEEKMNFAWKKYLSRDIYLAISICDHCLFDDPLNSSEIEYVRMFRMYFESNL